MIQQIHLLGGIGSEGGCALPTPLAIELLSFPKYSFPDIPMVPQKGLHGDLEQLRGL